MTRLDELGEDAPARAGVQEGDVVAAEAPPRRLVDELGAPAAELVESGRQVADGEGDVVQAGAAAGEEPADGAVRDRAAG